MRKKAREGGRGQIGSPGAEVILGVEMARVPKRTVRCACRGEGAGEMGRKEEGSGEKARGL